MAAVSQQARDPDQICAYCYKRQSSDAGSFLKCGKCRKRTLCSKECQRADWKHGHKLWCCRSGERGIDWEIRPCEGKGLGLYALRQFATNEVVLAERPLVLLPSATTPTELQSYLAKLRPTELAAFRALAPDGGSDMAKRHTNAFGCRDAGAGISGIFVHMSRANHDCIGNCSCWYDHKQGVRRLIASRAIQAGEELTLSYCPAGTEDVTFPGGTSTASRQAYLRRTYGFDCRCRACSNPAVGAKLEQVDELMDKLKALAQSMKLDAAIATGEIMVTIIEELQLDSGLFTFVYSDLFQVAILRKACLPKAKRYAVLAAEHAAAYYGEDDETTAEQRENARNPTAFHMYGMADRLPGGTAGMRGRERTH